MLFVTLVLCFFFEIILRINSEVSHCGKCLSVYISNLYMTIEVSLVYRKNKAY